jgi:Fe-S oxidoreductase
MTSKLSKGNIVGAYRKFRTHAVFPEIVSNICDMPCQDACIGAPNGASVQMRNLEQFCCNNTPRKADVSYRTPEKGKNVLIVGGGLCGLTCAVRLSLRGYSVKLLEKEDYIGGKLLTLNEDILPHVALENDFSFLYNLHDLTIKTGVVVSDLKSYDFDVALIATGKTEDIASWPSANGHILLSGSSDTDGSSIDAIRIGTERSYEIESLIKINRIRPNEVLDKDKRAKPNPEIFAPLAQPVKKNPALWVEEDAILEASRCKQCTCDSCVRQCDMLSHYARTPKQNIGDVADTIYRTMTSKKTAFRRITSCTQCGLCKEVCPVGIDFKHIYIESRQILHKNGELPEAMYSFWLDDMLHASSEASVFLPAKAEKAKYLYFPGCQMGASNPHYVLESVSFLKAVLLDNIAVFVSCCGAPAYWAGNEELHAKSIAEIRRIVTEAGNPTVILPCPTCIDMFRMHLPEISTISQWELMTEFKTEFAAQKSEQDEEETYFVFDPCSSKYDAKMQQSVRSLLCLMGYSIGELPSAGALARCCSFGGLSLTSSPEISKEMRQKNINMNEGKYVTYCTNCNDSFTLESKDSVHILDLLFSGKTKRDGLPSLSDRRSNRIAVKQALLKDAQQPEFIPEYQKFETIKLQIPPQVQKKMNNEFLHEDYIKKTILHAEDTGAKCFDPKNGWYSAHLRQGAITVWAQYMPDTKEQTYTLKNVYKHKMTIVESEAGF